MKVPDWYGTRWLDKKGLVHHVYACHYQRLDGSRIYSTSCGLRVDTRQRQVTESLVTCFGCAGLMRPWEYATLVVGEEYAISARWNGMTRAVALYAIGDGRWKLEIEGKASIRRIYHGLRTWEQYQAEKAESLKLREEAEQHFKNATARLAVFAPILKRRGLQVEVVSSGLVHLRGTIDEIARLLHDLESE